MIVQMKKTENIEPNIKIKLTFRHKSCLSQDYWFAFAQTSFKWQCFSKQYSKMQIQHRM